MIKVLLFDFDGTIADSFASFIEIAGKLAKKHNFPPLPLEELEKFRAEDPRALIKQLKIPFYKIPLLAIDMKKMQQEYIPRIHPFAGLPEVLYELKKKGFTLGILTSNGKENVKQFLKNNNLYIFDYIHSDSSLFGKDKAIRNFLKQHTFSKEDVIYVGDEIRDIQACGKVGIKIMSVTWGFNSKQGLVKYIIQSI